jgi:hypothetical protein
MTQVSATDGRYNPCGYGWQLYPSALKAVLPRGVNFGNTTEKLLPQYFEFVGKIETSFAPSLLLFPLNKRVAAPMFYGGTRSIKFWNCFLSSLLYVMSMGMRHLFLSK